jgi:hypothetical protein
LALVLEATKKAREALVKKAELVEAEKQCEEAKQQFEEAEQRLKARLEEYTGKEGTSTTSGQGL